MRRIDELFDAVVRGDDDAARGLVARALAGGCEPICLVHETLIPAMDEVGARFARGEYFVPQMLLSTRAMKQCLATVRPRLVGAATRPSARVVIGTVKGDMHDIGKNLVAALLEGGGFAVTDLGTNVGAEQFVSAVQEQQAHIVGLSALLTSTMTGMRAVIQALAAAGLRPGVKVLVGGAPVTRAFAEEIGADGYSNNAPDAVKVARSLLGLTGCSWQQSVSAAGAG